MYGMTHVERHADARMLSYISFLWGDILLSLLFLTVQRMEKGEGGGRREHLAHGYCQDD